MTVIPHFYVDPKSGFGLNNLPFGIFSRTGFDQQQVGIAIGDFVLDLAALEQRGLISPYDQTLLKNTPDFNRKTFFNKKTLNDFAALGTKARIYIRRQLQSLLSHPASPLADVKLQDQVLIKQSDIQLHYPFDTRGYTDFYSSEHHARRVGSLFRDPENALNQNWKQLPVAYHGRTSSLVAEKKYFKRPHGQVLIPKASKPIYSPTQKLDYEIEMGIFIGKGNQMFEPIPIEKARDSIFGFVIVNDWSARDIQAFEYTPLGPFLGKNFLTSISPWVVTPEALAPFAIQMPDQEILPVEYLQLSKRFTFDIQLTASLTTKNGHTHKLCTTNFSNQYWSLDQQIAHHTVNGCHLQTGDLLATGTLSGAKLEDAGCLLEMTENGKNPIHFSNGEQRAFLENNDTVRITAQCKQKSHTLWFGDVTNTVVE